MRDSIQTGQRLFVYSLTRIIATRAKAKVAGRTMVSVPPLSA